MKIIVQELHKQVDQNVFHYCMLSNIIHQSKVNLEVEVFKSLILMVVVLEDLEEVDIMEEHHISLHLQEVVAHHLFQVMKDVIQ